MAFEVNSVPLSLTIMRGQPLISTMRSKFGRETNDNLWVDEGAASGPPARAWGRQFLQSLSAPRTQIEDTQPRGLVCSGVVGITLLATSDATRYDALSWARAKAMKRRSRAGGKAVKARRGKAVTLKRRNVPKAVHCRSSSAADRKTEVARLSRELNEALERQTATAEILKIISASPTELQPVLDVVVKSAARFCEADDVTIFELDGQDLRATAHCGSVPQDSGVRFRCSREHVAGRAVLERKPIHILDLQAEAAEFPEESVFAKRLGHRTTAGVPLLREGVAIGTIQLRRAEVHPFTDRQIALLGIFAAQAVTAIENTRLLNELRQRTDDLTESLEQQTATSEVLQVISSSPGDLMAIFQSLLENAIHICGAKFGNLWLREAELFRVVASHGAPAAYREMLFRAAVRPGPDTGLGMLQKTKRFVQIDDITKGKRSEERRVGK